MTKQTAQSSERNQEIYEFLQSQPVGVLATVNSMGDPHAAVIYFGVDEEFNITFVTKTETRKYENLEQNNHVMLVAFEALSQTTVQITGLTENITDDPEANEVFSNALRAADKTSKTTIPPISKLFAGDYATYRLQPTQISMAVFAQPNYSKDMYRTIVFDR